MYHLIYTKFLIVLGYTIWLSIAAFNNIKDYGTNQFLIRKMVSMMPLEKRKHTGQGLLYRKCCNPKISSCFLNIIIGVQLIISVLLWLCVLLIITKLFHLMPVSNLLILQIATMGLTAAMALWLAFLCGGLWFGYWLHMGETQRTHMLLLIITLLTIILINLSI